MIYWDEKPISKKTVTEILRNYKGRQNYGFFYHRGNRAAIDLPDELFKDRVIAYWNVFRAFSERFQNVFREYLDGCEV